MARIAHIASDDLALRYLLLGQLSDLVASGAYDVTAISADGPEVEFIRSVGVKHISVYMTRRVVTPLADIRSLWKLYRVLRRERFDIVHTHTTKAGFLGRWAAKLARVPVIIHTNHGFVFHETSGSFWRRWFIWLEKSAAASSDLIFAVSEEDVETARRLKIGANKTTLLGSGGLGIDSATFDPSRFSAEERDSKRTEIGVPPDVPVVGFVGRLTREKGVLELFVASKLVRKEIPDVHFVIIGLVDTARSDPVTLEVAEEFGITNFCHFLGLRHDMGELYALMDVFTLPSYREGLPLVLMEASMMGIPSVGTRVRGSREVIEDGRTGTLVDPKDAVGLAAAIVGLLNEPDRAALMGQAGRERALLLFDERPVFEKQTREYERLLAEKSPSGAVEHR